MSKGVIMLSGGSSKSGLPAIHVNYPEGAVCTCSNAAKSYKAGDSNGSWLFAGLEAGTWTVAVTNGSAAVSESVVISQTQQLETITLSYSVELFNAGNKYTDLTGGWDYVSGSYISISLNDTSGYGQYAEANTKNKISMQGKKSLCCQVSSASTEGDNFCLGLTNELDTESMDSYEAYVAITGTGSFSLDVSAFDAEYYVAVLGCAGANTWSDSCSCKISRIWLE